MGLHSLLFRLLAARIMARDSRSDIFDYEPTSDGIAGDQVTLNSDSILTADPPSPQAGWQSVDRDTSSMTSFSRYTIFGVLPWLCLAPFQYGYCISQLNQVQKALTCGSKHLGLFGLPVCVPMDDASFGLVSQPPFRSTP